MVYSDGAEDRDVEARLAQARAVAMASGGDPRSIARQLARMLRFGFAFLRCGPGTWLHGSDGEFVLEEDDVAVHLAVRPCSVGLAKELIKTQAASLSLPWREVPDPIRGDPGGAVARALERMREAAGGAAREAEAQNEVSEDRRMYCDGTAHGLLAAIGMLTEEIRRDAAAASAEGPAQ